MGTTDTRLARRLLESLDALEVDYAVLHSAARVAELQTISDIDLLVDDEPANVIRRLKVAVDSCELAHVLTWRYDTGALTTFWMTPGLADGVQLDLIRDPEGSGRYGVRTVDLADAFRIDAPWPRHLTERGTAHYLFAKRLVKGDVRRWEEAAHILRTGGGIDLALFAPRRQRVYRRAYEGRFPGRAFRVQVLARQRLSHNGTRRLVRRTGEVVEVSGRLDQEARRFLEERVRPVVPQIVFLRRRPGALRRWSLTRRPRIVVVEVGGPSMSGATAARQIWEALRARAYEESP
ncbi:MAG TPA: hypothetical protein VGE38_05455 [Nocardioides sp.]|uniref:hypothetical protein n=1 Tax=Nocardioides sp. TaxID=35761 RepID=UPI002EDA6083